MGAVNYLSLVLFNFLGFLVCIWNQKNFDSILFAGDFVARNRIFDKGNYFLDWITKLFSIENFTLLLGFSGFYYSVINQKNKFFCISFVGYMLIESILTTMKGSIIVTTLALFFPYAYIYPKKTFKYLIVFSLLFNFIFYITFILLLS